MLQIIWHASIGMLKKRPLLATSASQHLACLFPIRRIKLLTAVVANLVFCMQVVYVCRASGFETIQNLYYCYNLVYCICQYFFFCVVSISGVYEHRLESVCSIMYMVYNTAYNELHPLLLLQYQQILLAMQFCCICLTKIIYANLIVSNLI